MTILKNIIFVVLIPGEIKELVGKREKSKHEIKELKEVVSTIEDVQTETLQTIDL